MQSDSPPIDPKRDLNRLKLLYDLYRDYMKHEDDLINQRSYWHLLIQGFLFATMGVLGEWPVLPNANGYLWVNHKYLVFVLAGAGILIAILVAVSMQAAENAIEALCSKWAKRIKLEFDHDQWELVPDLAGGGAKRSKGLGKLAARFIPMVIITAWILIGIMAVYGIRHQ